MEPAGRHSAPAGPFHSPLLLIPQLQALRTQLRRRSPLPRHRHPPPGRWARTCPLARPCASCCGSCSCPCRWMGREGEWRRRCGGGWRGRWGEKLRWLRRGASCWCCLVVSSLRVYYATTSSASLSVFLSQTRVKGEKEREYACQHLRRLSARVPRSSSVEMGFVALTPSRARAI
mgnify:CR=1 FL=1